MEPNGLDLYNQTMTGRVSKTLMASCNSDQIPCLLEMVGGGGKNANGEWNGTR